MKILSTLALLLTCAIASAQLTYIHCGKLVDTKNGKVLENKTLIIDGE